MQAILKYTIPLSGHNLFKEYNMRMHKKARILDAQVQDDSVVMWAEVDKEYVDEEEQFSIFENKIIGVFPTGLYQSGEFNDMYERTERHISTIRYLGLILHIYEMEC